MANERTIAIDGVYMRPLRVIPTDGGSVLHMLRSDASDFKGFGEVYFSEVLPGAVKAWKCHTRQTQRFAVPVGRLKVVLYDGREHSPTPGAKCEVVLGRPDHYALLTIPPNIWYGFTALDDTPALLCNCADIPHTPDEALRLPKDDASIPYVW